MKTLILFGSPNKDGNTMALVKEMLPLLPGKVDLIDVYRQQIAPCQDCKYCQQKAGCAIKDDMQEVYRKIEESDVIVIATPMHFGIVTAPMFNLFTRLQTYWSARFVRKDNDTLPQGKLGALVVTSGTRWLNMRHLLEGVTDMAFEHMGVDNVAGSVYAYRTDKLPAGENEPALEQVRELAHRLAEQGIKPN